METTVSPFFIRFDGRSVVERGGLLLDLMPEHVFPVEFGTSATAIINSPYPRLDAFGCLSMAFSVSVVVECVSHMGAWKAFYDWLEVWKGAGRGEWVWGDGCGHEQRFEAILSDAEPKVQGLCFVVSYNFKIGRPL